MGLVKKALIHEFDNVKSYFNFTLSWMRDTMYINCVKFEYQQFTVQ